MDRPPAYPGAPSLPPSAVKVDTPDPTLAFVASAPQVDPCDETPPDCDGMLPVLPGGGSMLHPTILKSLDKLDKIGEDARTGFNAHMKNSPTAAARFQANQLKAEELKIRVLEAYANISQRLAPPTRRSDISNESEGATQSSTRPGQLSDAQMDRLSDILSRRAPIDI